MSVRDRHNLLHPKQVAGAGFGGGVDGGKSNNMEDSQVPDIQPEAVDLFIPAVGKDFKMSEGVFCQF